MLDYSLPHYHHCSTALHTTAAALLDYSLLHLCTTALLITLQDAAHHLGRDAGIRDGRAAADAAAGLCSTFRRVQLLYLQSNLLTLLTVFTILTTRTVLTKLAILTTLTARTQHLPW